MNKRYTLFFALTLICAVVVAGIYAYRPAPRQEPQVTEDTEGVTTIDITKPSATFEGLPNDLPINKASLVEQKRLAYPAQGTILYSLSYRTPRTPEDVVSEYKTYLTDHGYALHLASTTSASAISSIGGHRIKDNISITITPGKGFNLVQLAVLYKK